MNDNDPDADPQPLVDAFAITAGQMGGRWVDPRVVDGLHRIVVRRDGKALFRLFVQAVRLAALMEAAHPAGYVGFLYELPRLDAAAFRRALVARAGRLAGAFTVAADGVTFLAPAHAADERKPFDLAYGQMPAAAVCLDVLHNCLGIPPVAAVLAPAFDPAAPAGTARDVVTTLDRTFERWVRRRLVTDSRLAKAVAIETFIVGTRPPALADRPLGELVDDELVLAFWCELMGSERADALGLKTFPSAARTVLHFLAALETDAVERGLVAAHGFVRDDGSEAEVAGDGRPVALTRGLDAYLAEDGGPAPLRSYAGEAALEAWQSPLAALLAPPCDRVNWLPKTETRLLSRILQGHEETRAVFPEAPDPRFFRTLVRALRFWSEPDSREPHGYAPSAAELADLAAKSRDLGHATVRALLRRGGADEAAVGLFATLEPDTMRAMAGGLAGARDYGDVVAAVAARLRAGRDPAGAALRRAKVVDMERAGFRDADRADPAFEAPLELGAPHVARLAAEIAKVATWLGERDLAADFAADAPRLAAAYAEGRARLERQKRELPETLGREGQ